ncbi:MAG: FecR domain-containing protein [Bryobacteraceae bacterium]
MRLKSAAVLVTLGFAVGACAQEVVSARAGLVHYLEGKVFLEGNELGQISNEKLFTQAPTMKDGQELTTGLGRAEILLAPGIVLRIGEESAIRMIRGSLEDTKLELLRGDAVLSIEELLKENRVTIACANASIVPEQTGVYRIRAGETPELLVYDGKARVMMDDERVATLKRGRVISLAKAEQSRKFDVDETSDALQRWSMRRSRYLALANVSAAKSMLDSGNYSSVSGWRWNPYFGMFTFIPARGVICNGLWGYCFYTPGSVYSAIYRPVYRSPRMSNGGFSGPSYGYNSSYGYGTASSRTYGDYSPPSGSPAASAVSSAPATAPRAAESSVGRGAGGGGRSR